MKIGNVGRNGDCVQCGGVIMACKRCNNKSTIES